MAELLGRLLNAQNRLRPYIEQYRALMQTDRPLLPGVSICCFPKYDTSINWFFITI